MGESSEISQLIWDSRLTAERNYQYYAEYANLYQRWDRGAKIFVAIASSTAVAGWTVWSTPGLSWIWPGSSALAALVALAQSILDPTKSIKTASQLTSGWFSIHRKYDLLWAGVRTLNVSEADAFKECQKIIEEEKPLADLEVTLTPRGRRQLVLSREKEVLSRGYRQEDSQTVAASAAQPQA